MAPSAEEWLCNEDKQCWDDRLNRLKWIIDEYSNIDMALFHGGLKSYYLFEEARYCFVYGQYIASTLLSLSYIENILASVFYTAGRNDLQRAHVVDLLNEAKKEGVICESEFTVLNKIREIRNSMTHFRKPCDKETTEYRAIEEDRHPYELLEEDAKIALKTTFRMLEKFSVRKQES